MARPALGRVARPEEAGRRLAPLDRDRTLVVAAQADPARFDALYRKYVAQVYSYAIYELRDPHEAEDVTARTFLSALTELPRFQEEFGIVSGTSTHADRLATIRAVFEESEEVIDPHTADGVKVAREYVEPGVPMLVLETAKPEKFAETIREAIGVELDYSSDLRAMLEAPQHVTEMADDQAALRAFIEAHALR